MIDVPILTSNQTAAHELYKAEKKEQMDRREQNILRPDRKKQLSAVLRLGLKRRLSFLFETVSRSYETPHHGVYREKRVGGGSANAECGGSLTVWGIRDKKVICLIFFNHHHHYSLLETDWRLLPD